MPNRSLLGAGTCQKLNFIEFLVNAAVNAVSGDETTKSPLTKDVIIKEYKDYLWA